MNAIGGELGQLADLKSTFDRESTNVSELTSTINSHLYDTYWVGPAAERFKQEWESQFKPALTKLQTALVEAGGEVSRRREALIQAGS